GVPLPLWGEGREGELDVRPGGQGRGRAVRGAVLVDPADLHLRSWLELVQGGAESVARGNRGALDRGDDRKPGDARDLGRRAGLDARHQRARVDVQAQLVGQLWCEVADR